MILLKSLKFWVLVVGLLVYIASLYVPGFPLSEEIVLRVVLFVLGLFHIQPEIIAQYKATFVRRSAK